MGQRDIIKSGFTANTPSVTTPRSLQSKSGRIIRTLKYIRGKADSDIQIAFPINVIDLGDSLPWPNVNLVFHHGSGTVLGSDNAERDTSSVLRVQRDRPTGWPGTPNLKDRDHKVTAESEKEGITHSAGLWGGSGLGLVCQVA